MLEIFACDIEPTSEPVTFSEMIGRYYPNYKAGLNEFIELRIDSSYVHYFKSKKGIEYFDSSYYGLYYEMADSTRPVVLFYDFIDRYPLASSGGYSKTGSLDTLPHNWFPYVLKTDNKIMIKRDSDKKQYYIRH